MSIAKRVLALAAAGATALVLGGVLSTTHQATRVDAAGPVAGAIGCANSSNANDIAFATVGGFLVGATNGNGNGNANGGTTGNGNFNGQIVTGIPTVGAAGTVTNPGGSLNVLAPLGIVECGAVFQDFTATATNGSAIFPGAVDNDPNTIDGGTITYNLNAFSNLVEILESGTNTSAVNCGSSTPPTGTATAGAGAVAAAPSVQTVTITGATGGTFTLGFGGQATGPLPFNATAAQVAAALNGLPAIAAAGGVTVTGPAGGPYVITFVTPGVRTPITVDATGLTPAAATNTSTGAAAGTTPGAAATAGTGPTTTLTTTGAAGTTFTLTVNGATTATITNPATAGAVAAAVNALGTVAPAVGTGGPTGTGGAPVVLTFPAGTPTPTVTATPGAGATAVPVTAAGTPGTAAVPATASITTAGTAPGAVTITAGGASTTVPVGATPAQAAAAINALGTIPGGVTGSGANIGAGTTIFTETTNFGPAIPISASGIAGAPAATGVVATTGGANTLGVNAVAAGAAVFAITNVGGLESCQAGIPNTFGTTAVVSPTVGNIVHVAFRTGATFGTIGTATPAIFLTATYNRFPALSNATFTNGAGVTGSTFIAQGPSSLTTGGALINITLPTYAMTLTPSPATIPAALGSGAGSTITAAMFRQVNTSCVPLALGSGFAICTAASGAAISINSSTNFVAGSEPGNITFATSMGVFGTPAAVGQSAQQIVTVHCGANPGTTPVVLQPNALSPLQGVAFSFSSCISATATLYGGGSAGTATVTGDFIGDLTGATASAATTVAFGATAATVNLSRGCNEVITPANTAVGATIASIVSLVQPSGIVVSIWRFNNATKVFEAGFFNTAGAPTDFSTTGPSQSLFICVSAASTFPTGAF